MSTETRQRKRRKPHDPNVVRAFGENVEYLTPEEAGSATPNERLESVWPFIVREATRFWNRLSAHEKPSVDLEDVIGELAIEVLQKDDKYDASKNYTYAAYVGTIIRNRLLGLRESLHIVSSPKNAACTLKHAARLSQQGLLPDRRRMTTTDIIRTMCPADPIESAMDTVDHAPTYVEGEVELHERMTTRGSIAKILGFLTPTEAYLIGSKYGIYGSTAPLPPCSGRTIRSALKKLKKASDDHGIF